MELFAQKAMELARANTAANDARVVAPFHAAGVDWKAREAKEEKFASLVSMKPVNAYQVWILALLNLGYPSASYLVAL